MELFEKNIITLHCHHGVGGILTETCLRIRNGGIHLLAIFGMAYYQEQGYEEQDSNEYCNHDDIVDPIESGTPLMLGTLTAIAVGFFEE